MRLRHYVLVLGSLAAAAAAAAAGAQQIQDPFVEKVEVRVRTVLVFITDAKGKPLATPPAPSGLRVIENGRPAEVLAIEPARHAKVAPAPTAGTPATAAPAAAALAPTPPSVSQYLYLDTTSLRQRSVPRIVKTLGSNLDALLANGPLEVVVADPEPRVILPSTRDAPAIRSTLEKLPTTAVGKQRIYDARRDALNQMTQAINNPNRVGSSPYRTDTRAAIRQEMALIKTSLDRLDTWAATLPYDQASVVYLCNDGFDGDLTEVYRKILMDSLVMEDHQAAMQLQMDFGREAANVTARAAEVLAGRGATAVVLAFGGNDPDFAMSAANMGKLASGAIHRPLNSVPLSYFARPNEPLLTIADRTGGQVVSAESRLPRVLDEVGAAYIVSFRSHLPADGAPHPLEVVSESGALRVRAPRSVLAATKRDASAGQAVRALSAPSAAGSLPVTVDVTPLEELENGRTKGALVVTADLASIVEALERTGHGRIRVTVAVENSKGPPFTQSEEMDLDHSGTGTIWSYESAIVWPSDATRVAVTVEELKTGTSGSAVVDLPKP